MDEFNKILDSLYEKDYILVDIGDVWSETTGEGREMAFFIGRYLLGRRRSAARCLPLSIAQIQGK